MSVMNNAYALVVGIANYQTVNKLPSSVLKDAQDICELLVDPKHCGYPPENVQLLLDKEATHLALRQGLTKLSACSEEESTVLIYFSCHGGHIESGLYAGEYLLPVDVDCFSAHSLAETAISGTGFTAALRAIPAQKVIVIFDCCHAAGIGLPKDGSVPLLKAGLPESYYETLQTGRGRAILASSRSTEYSYVMPGADNSLFTQYLLTGLRGGISSEDGLIRIFNLFEYIQPRVTSDQPSQHPVFKAELEENFPVALYLGRQKRALLQSREEFRYDAYVSYARKEPDASLVWKTLVPRLEEAGLRVAVSGTVEEPGVALILGIERAIEQSKRIVAVLSKTYLAGKWVHFQNVLAQTLGVEERQARILPIVIEKELVDEYGYTNQQVRLGLRMLIPLVLTDPHTREHNLNRLVELLKRPLPQG